MANILARTPVSKAFVSLGDYALLLGQTAESARRAAHEVRARADANARGLAAFPGRSPAAASPAPDAAGRQGEGGRRGGGEFARGGEDEAALGKLRAAEAIDQDARRYVRQTAAAAAAARSGRGGGGLGGARQAVIVGWGNYEHYAQVSLASMSDK